jgi:hypothetical protein
VAAAKANEPMATRTTTANAMTTRFIFSFLSEAFDCNPARHTAGDFMST